MTDGNDNFFDGEQTKRMKLTQKLLDKGIMDIYIQNKPRQFKIEYEFNGQPQKAIEIPVLEFPFPTVEPIKNLVDGTMNIETVTEIMGYIILNLGEHWDQIYDGNGDGNGNGQGDGLTDEYAKSLNDANKHRPAINSKDARIRFAIPRVDCVDGPTTQSPCGEIQTERWQGID